MYVWCCQQASRPAVSRKGSIKWYCIVLCLILCNFDHSTSSYPWQFWALDIILSFVILIIWHHLILYNFDHFTSSYLCIVDLLSWVSAGRYYHPQWREMPSWWRSDQLHVKNTGESPQLNVFSFCRPCSVFARLFLALCVNCYCQGLEFPPTEFSSRSSREKGARPESQFYQTGFSGLGLQRMKGKILFWTFLFSEC